MTTPAASEFVVYVDGDDSVLVSAAVSELVDHLVGNDSRELAVEDIGGDEIDLAAVADGCATPPFLADRRIVIVRDVGRFSTDEVSPLVAYLGDPLSSTVLVLAAGEGAIAPKLLAAVKGNGRVVETKVAARDARDWVRDRMRRAPVRLDPDAEALVIAHLGEDVSRLGALLELLSSAFDDGARLTAEDIGPYLGTAGAVAPWDFTDAIDAGTPEKALLLLDRLLNAGERHPLVVLAIIQRHVQSLLRVDSPGIRTEAQAAEAMGIAKGRSTYPAKKALTAAGRWGSASIAEAVGLVADAELALKGASAWPADAVLEVLVARLCRLARTRGGAPAPSRRRG